MLQDVQAGVSPDEYALVEPLTKSYQPLLDALARRGLDPQYLKADAWCCGHTGPEYDPTERLCWPHLLYCDPTAGDEIQYSRPIDGIEVIISLTKKKVIRFEDKAWGVLPIPGTSESFSYTYVKKEDERKDLKPIVITQPEGPSWKISNTNTVDWASWKFQIGFNSREGATLHGLTFKDRSIAHKFSYCEMVVPYGDPRFPHTFKNAFDAGEDGLGRNANSLVLGCDCLGVIRYFDANIISDNGDLNVIKNAICLHEEDAGMCWKHTDWRTGIPFQKRNRRLVISFICTIANYEYGFYYHLYPDGTIECDVKLTGILSTGALSYEEQKEGGRKYGVNLGGCLYAPVHQHFFVVRVDFTIDGTANQVVELEARRDDEGPHNETLNAFFFEERILGSELDAVRDLCPEKARFWKVQSTTTKNRIGAPTGYKIAPYMKCLPFAPLDRASHLKRAQFLEHQVWVTSFNKEERYPGGEFPNQNPFLDGLPKWTKRDANIYNTDLVFWHVFGVTHLPRPEDWPIMPAEQCGFSIKPCNFFESSQVMDLPSGNDSTSVCNNHGCH